MHKEAKEHAAKESTPKVHTASAFKKNLVDWVLWDGKNQDAVAELCGSAVSYKFDGEQATVFSPYGLVTAQPGMYLVKEGDDHITSCTAENFKHQYEVTEVPKPAEAAKATEEKATARASA